MTVEELEKYLEDKGMGASREEIKVRLFLSLFVS